MSDCCDELPQPPDHRRIVPKTTKTTKWSSRSKTTFILTLINCLLASQAILCNSIHSEGDNFEPSRRDATVGGKLPPPAREGTAPEAGRKPANLTKQVLVQIQPASIANVSLMSSIVSIIDRDASGNSDATLDGATGQQAVSPTAAAQSAWHGTDRQLEVSQTVGRAPVYMSAPKQISEIGQLKGSAKSTERVQLGSVAPARHPDVTDLNAAAGNHYKKPKKKKKKVIIVKKKKKKHRKKKKVIVVKKKKKKKKHKKKKKKKKKKHFAAASYHPVSKLVHDAHEHVVEAHYEPAAQHHRHHSGGEHGKYYEYREVPKKGAWDFGYRRGNEKHLIERKEHGHRSHFKTEVHWKDKKGKGHHLWDYNHGDHKKGHHYAAAATQIEPSTGVAMGTKTKPATGRR